MSYYNNKAKSLTKKDFDKALKVFKNKKNFKFEPDTIFLSPHHKYHKLPVTYLTKGFQGKKLINKRECPICKEKEGKDASV